MLNIRYEKKLRRNFRLLSSYNLFFGEKCKQLPFKPHFRGQFKYLWKIRACVNWPNIFLLKSSASLTYTVSKTSVKILNLFCVTNIFKYEKPLLCVTIFFYGQMPNCDFQKAGKLLKSQRELQFLWYPPYIFSNAFCLRRLQTRTFKRKFKKRLKNQLNEDPPKASFTPWPKSRLYFLKFLEARQLYSDTLLRATVHLFQKLVKPGLIFLFFPVFRQQSIPENN